MRWLENRVPSPRIRDAAAAGILESVIEDVSVSIAVSSLTLVEIRSAISRDWRAGEAADAQFDAQWAEKSNLEVMALVASRRIGLVETPPRAFEHAATLVHLATEEHLIALGTWDAIHLITAARWSLDVGAVVSLFTSDDGFQRFVGHYPEFTQFVNLVDLNRVLIRSW